MTTFEASGYWYAGEESAPGSIELLNLLREYRDAERKMRLQTRDSMGMGENDMEALRYLLRAHAQGEIPRQRELAKELGISDASTSGLIDRLCCQGYAERVIHPDDRRSAGIVPTDFSNQEVRESLEEMHHRMHDAISQLSPADRAGAARFLRLLIDSLNATAQARTRYNSRKSDTSGSTKR